MKYLLIAGIVFSLLTGNFAFGYSISEFVDKYQYSLSEGQWVQVLVTVKGEPESQDPIKRAKEIRYLQSGVLKFIHIAGAKNVKSDTWNNEFTAQLTSSLVAVIENRSDVLSVKEIGKVQVKKVTSEYSQDLDKCTNEEFPVDWSGCNLYGKIITHVDLRYANLTNANLYGTTLSGKDLTGIDFSNAFLKKADLDGVNLTNANLSDVNLIDTKIRNADLTNANMFHATLWRTDFTNSDLTNADLRNSVLAHAVLADVNLDGANLEGAGTWSTNLNHCYNHPICG